MLLGKVRGRDEVCKGKNIKGGAKLWRGCIDPSRL